MYADCGESSARDGTGMGSRRSFSATRCCTFGPTAPPLAPTVDVEQMVAAWRRLREERAVVPTPVEAPGSPPSPRRWWRRLLGR